MNNLPENKTVLGVNKTGIQMSPLDSKSLIDFANKTPADVQGTEEALAKTRAEYVTYADSLGSVALPGTLKGGFTVTLEKMSGTNIEIFFDKLGERIAFERMGVRLYDALIAKFNAINPSPEMKEALLQFREEEKEHLKIVMDAMQMLGGDPTSETPCANAVGVASAGILKIIADPRSDVPQSLQALLMAESTDVVGWELLINLAKMVEQEKLAHSFSHACKQEQHHEEMVKKFLFHELSKSV